MKKSSKNSGIRIEVYSTDNKDKVNLVKRYSNGTYYTNQQILGKQFYRRWLRISLKDVNQLIRSDFHGNAIHPVSVFHKVKV